MRKDLKTDQILKLEPTIILNVSIEIRVRVKEMIMRRFNYMEN